MFTLEEVTLENLLSEVERRIINSPTLSLHTRSVIFNCLDQIWNYLDFSYGTNSGGT